MKATGAIKIPYLGVRYIAVTADWRRARSFQLHMARSCAGIRMDRRSSRVRRRISRDSGGGCCFEVNGVKVEDNNALTNLVERYNIGDTITLKMQRGDKTKDIPAILTERPASQ